MASLVYGKHTEGCFINKVMPQYQIYGKRTVSLQWKRKPGSFPHFQPKTILVEKCMMYSICERVLDTNRNTLMFYEKYSYSTSHNVKPVQCFR